LLQDTLIVLTNAKLNLDKQEINCFPSSAVINYGTISTTASKGLVDTAECNFKNINFASVKNLTASSWVIYNGTNQQIDRGINFYNLIFRGNGTKQTKGKLIIFGNMKIGEVGENTRFSPGTDSVIIKGNLSTIAPQNATTFLQNQRAILVFSGINQEIKIDTSVEESLYNVLFYNDTAKLDCKISISANGELSLQNAIVDAGKSSIRGTGKLRINANSKIYFSKTDCILPEMTGTVSTYIFDPGSSIYLQGNGNQTLRANRNYSNVIFNNGTKAFSNELNNNWKIDSLALVNCTLNILNQDFGNFGTNVTMSKSAKIEYKYTSSSTNITPFTFKSFISDSSCTINFVNLVTQNLGSRCQMHSNSTYISLKPIYPNINLINAAIIFSPYSSPTQLFKVASGSKINIDPGSIIFGLRDTRIDIQNGNNLTINVDGCVRFENEEGLMQSANSFLGNKAKVNFGLDNSIYYHGDTLQKIDSMIYSSLLILSPKKFYPSTIRWKRDLAIKNNTMKFDSAFFIGRFGKILGGKFNHLDIASNSIITFEGIYDNYVYKTLNLNKNVQINNYSPLGQLTLCNTDSTQVHLKMDDKNKYCNIFPFKIIQPVKYNVSQWVPLSHPLIDGSIKHFSQNAIYNNGIAIPYNVAGILDDTVGGTQRKIAKKDFASYAIERHRKNPYIDSNIHQIGFLGLIGSNGIWLTSQAKKLQFEGYFFNDTVLSHADVYSTTEHDGWFLQSNPYVNYILWSNADQKQLSTIYPWVYQLNSEQAESYACFHLSTNIRVPESTPIKNILAQRLYQSVILKKRESTRKPLLISPKLQYGGSLANLNSTNYPTPDSLVRLNISRTDGRNTETVVWFSDTCREIFNDTEDCWLYPNDNPQIPTLFSRAGDEKLIIQGLPFNPQRYIPIGYTMDGRTGNLKISLKNASSLPFEIGLIDSLTMTRTNLSTGSYTFNHNPARTINRFGLYVIQFPTGISNQNPVTSSKVKAFQTSESSLHIEYDPTLCPQESEIALYSIDGRLLQKLSGKVINTRESIDINEINLIPGIYLLKIGCLSTIIHWK
jgi:hypothetical protein